MSDDYTNLDLDTAEELLIQAGKPELAQALRYQAQGVRNLVQGEWGISFVNALENVMDTRVVSVLTSVQQRLDEQIGLVEQILAVHKETARGLKKLEKDVRSLNTRHGKQIAQIARRMDASEQDRADLRARLERIEQRLSDGT